MRLPGRVRIYVLILSLAVGLAGTAAGNDPLIPPEGTSPPDQLPPGSLRDEIIEIPPDSLVCNGTITFDDVAGGDPPGTNYDVIFESNGADLAERFVGQTLTYLEGVFDVLAAEADEPLTLQVGLPNENLCVFWYEPVLSQILSGLGPLGFPDYEAIGEGSFAVLFDYDQSQFGFELIGGNEGNAIVNFFRRDGSLIDTFVIPNLGTETYAFMRAGGVSDIAGISIHNDDPGGIGVDNLCHDVEGVPGQPPVCDANGPYEACVGEEITFDGTGSYDPDGTIVSYEWDFGDGEYGSGDVATHVYDAADVYTVTLCVEDDEGMESCCETTATIDEATPVGSASWGEIKSIYR